MNVYTESDRYTVLLHAFDTFEGACEYITQIINVGECKVLPLIKAWNGGVVTAKWMAKKTDKGIKFSFSIFSSVTFFKIPIFKSFFFVSNKDITHEINHV